jgi:tRNA (guanine10-N2)-dimethyltransferase
MGGCVFMIKTKSSDEEVKYASREYFYTINYPRFEEDLCKIEMKYLFNKIPNEKYLFSGHYISPSRSPFIKQCISVIYSGDCLDEIISRVVSDKFSCEQFKVSFVKLEDEEIDYDERLRSIREIGLVINGESEMYDPKILLGVTKVRGRWIFGIYEKNDYEWHIHDSKPYKYSIGLGIKVSRALVNIAVGNDLDCTIVDPCCGVGTVLIEALSLGFNIKGYEINNSIGENAKKNLEFFGYDDVVTIGDMHDIKDNFDIAIIDLPYGVFSRVTLKEQIDIIKTARRIAERMVIISFEDMDDYITSAGFNIVDKCNVCKGKFKRYITICN